MSPARVPAPETVSLQAYADALADSAWTFDGPIVVLTRSRWVTVEDTADDLARLKLWTELQGDLASRSPRSRRVLATNSGHYVQNDEPALVIDAVREIVGAR